VKKMMMNHLMMSLSYCYHRWILRHLSYCFCCRRNRKSFRCFCLSYPNCCGKEKNTEQMRMKILRASYTLTNCFRCCFL
jgi:hypothetical protein